MQNKINFLLTKKVLDTRRVGLRPTWLNQFPHQGREKFTLNSLRTRNR